VALASAQTGPRAWWAPGQGTPIADFASYPNDHGSPGVLNTSGNDWTGLPRRMAQRGRPGDRPGRPSRTPRRHHGAPALTALMPHAA
jgi:hypothetical protein